METLKTHHVCFRTSSKTKRTGNAHMTAANTEKHGAQLQTTMTKIRNGGTAKQMKRLQTAWTCTVTMESGHYTASA